MNKTCRILIVEDESIIADDIRMSLEEFGHTVIAIASTGEEAVKLSTSERPDLILFDIMLKSRMTGIEAAQIIRETINVPHIYTTAYTDSEILKEAWKTGPCGILGKPVTDMDLQDMINKCLGSDT